MFKILQIIGQIVALETKQDMTPPKTCLLAIALFQLK